MPRLPLLLSLLLPLLLTVGCVGTGAVAADRGNDDLHYIAGDGRIGSAAPAARSPAPRIAGRTLTGAALDVSGWRGSVVVVNFWASWCAPCIAELPGLERVYQATRGLGVRFIGVDSKDGQASARGEATRAGLTYPSIFDQPNRTALRFNGHRFAPNCTPSTVVLDRAGRVAAGACGPVTPEELTPVVRAVAAEPAR